MSDSETYRCPLCSHECRSQNHLKEHLHERHAKSEIIERLLAASNR